MFLFRTLVCFRRLTIPSNRILRSETSFALYETKYFKDVENDVLHRIMEGLPAYQASIIPHPKMRHFDDEWKETSKPIFQQFSDLTHKNLKEHRHLGCEEFTFLSRSLAKSFATATYQEILETLYCLTLWPKTPKAYEPNFKRIWTLLDHECTRRLNQWSISEKLLIADFWYHLRLSRISVYNYGMIKNLCQKSTLSPHQLVQLMFYINVQRDVPREFFVNLQSDLEEAVKQISAEEMNIICLGHFKSDNYLTNQNIMKAIMNKTGDNIAIIDSNEIIGTLKCLRASFQYHMVGYYATFLKKCAVVSHKWELITLVHTALLSSASFVYEPFLFDNVIEKFEVHIDSSRLKDISKLIQCLSLFNYLPDSKFNNLLLDEIMKETREEEILNHFQDCINLIVFYAYMGLYRYDVMRKYMDSKYLKYCPDYAKKSFAILDYCIDIECRDYKGPRLEPHLRNFLIEKHRDLPDSSNGTIVKVTKSVYDVLCNIYGTNNVCVRRILPHMFNPDIIVRLSGDSCSLPIAEICDKKSSFELLHPPEDEIWAAVVICGSFAFAFNTDRLCGLIVLRHRQLETLGYKVALVHHRHFPYDDLKKEKYMKDKLRNCEMSAASCIKMKT